MLQSKYRHVYGSKSKVNYENVKISGSAWDTDLVAAGGKYLSVNWQASGGGVCPLFLIPSKPFRIAYRSCYHFLLSAGRFAVAWCIIEYRLLRSSHFSHQPRLLNLQGSQPSFPISSLLREATPHPCSTLLGILLTTTLLLLLAKMARVGTFTSSYVCLQILTIHVSIHLEG